MGDREHIIIVDDEADVRETFGEYLAMRGYEVSLADLGKALRDCLAGRTADLVLLDLNLPGEDGLTLARDLREETDAAIIMVTAADEAIDRVDRPRARRGRLCWQAVRPARACRPGQERCCGEARRARSRSAPRAGENRRIAFGTFVLDLDGDEL